MKIFIDSANLQEIEEALKRGFIVLPSGPSHNVISITPPLILSEQDIQISIKAFGEILKKI